MNKKITALLLSAALACSALTGCAALTGTQNTQTQTAAESQTASADAPETASTDAQASASAEATAIAREAEEHETVSVSTEGAAEIALNGNSVSVTGSGAEVTGTTVLITEAGTYVLRGTLNDGRVVVAADKGDVTLVLDGADITCSYSSPIYIYSASNTVIYVTEGTENFLTDGTGYSYADDWSSEVDEDPDACLYSKDDLAIEGGGTLTVNANYNNGVTCKDTLAICDVTLIVHAANHGVNGKDSLVISGADVTVTAGGDAIRSTNDTDGTLGWISAADSVLNLDAGDDGIQAETVLTVTGGTLDITASGKGMKAGTELVISDGEFTIDSGDDAVHTNGNMTVSGGVFTVSTGDDAFHADGDLTIGGGELTVTECYEGIEATHITISGDSIDVIASDDGINAGGGDGSGAMGAFGADRFGGGSGTITLTGGTVLVRSRGDGVDSNGSITMSGGTLLVASSGTGDGALDYDGAFELTGGTLLAVGNSNMAQAPGSPAQYTVFANLTTQLASGDTVEISNGSTVFSFELPISANSIVYSAPELSLGDTVTITSGGSAAAEITITDYLTASGAVSMGGPGGGMPGGPGNMGGQGSFGGPGGRN